MENNEKALESIRKFTGDDSIEFVDENHVFKFKCQQCGRCCMGREDIILNPFDIYNGARYLGITPMDFLEKYTFTTLGGHSKIPIILLKTDDNGYCPLLKFDVKDGGKFKCMIHEAKPGACSNHPIGVAYSTEKDKLSHKVTSFIKVKQCDNSTSDEEHVVKDWVKPYMDHIDEINVAHDLQHLVATIFDTRLLYKVFNFIATLSDEDFESDLDNEENREDLKENLKEISQMAVTTFGKYCMTTIGKGYAEYDINKPFIEQAKANIEELTSFYDTIKMIYEKTKECVKALTGKEAEEYFKDDEE